MDATNMLQRLIDSNYRVAALKTRETDRLLALFKRYSLTTGQAVYDWTAHSGLYRIGSEHILIPRTRSLADVLAYIAASRHYGIYLLQGFEPMLALPSIQRAFCRLLDINDGTRRLVLLIGTDVDIPMTLRGRIAAIRHNTRERHPAAPATSQAHASVPLAEHTIIGVRCKTAVTRSDGSYLVAPRGNSVG